VSPFNTSTICATLVGSILQPSLSFAHTAASVLVVPPPSSFLVVDILPGRKFERVRSPGAPKLKLAAFGVLPERLASAAHLNSLGDLRIASDDCSG
jgi:hypothetical protein